MFVLDRALEKKTNLWFPNLSAESLSNSDATKDVKTQTTNIQLLPGMIGFWIYLKWKSIGFLLYDILNSYMV